MSVDDCLACQILRGEISSPGGLVYADDFWQVDHALAPIFVPGLLIIRLNRHCEHLAELTPLESAALGPLIQKVCRALQQVTDAPKLHVASYGEGLQHVHFLVRPRAAQMPASNVQLTFWLLWRRFWYQMGCKKLAYPESQAAVIARQVADLLSG